MPEMDSPQVSGVVEQGSSPTPTTVVRGLHLTKRPREEGSPLATLGKRGRGENGDISLTLQIPVPAALLPPSGVGNRSPPAAPAAPQARQQPALSLPQHHHHPPPPLCESPGKTNQPPHNLSASASSTSNSFAPFSGGSGGGGEGDGDVESAAAKSSVILVASPSASASTPEALSGESFPTARRKYQHAPCTPYVVARAGAEAAAAAGVAAAVAAVKPSLGATDPIFHAALLRLLHRRGGMACPEAPAWCWRGSAPARFEHWPRALHPSVMDLLACVSAGEERVVLTGCDMKKDTCGEVESPPTPQMQEAQPPREAAAWRAPRPRTSAKRGAAAPPGTPLAHTPIARSAQTPLSALRRPGSACRSANRVRFSTHDMSVVDTPDPSRGGSEEGMVSALDGLESILSAAEKVRGIAASASGAAAAAGGAAAAAPAWGSSRGRSGGRGSGGGDGNGISCRLSPEGSNAGDRHFEGYFDRFSSAGRPNVGAAAAADVAAAPAVATEGSETTGSEGRVAGDDDMGQGIGDGAARMEEEEEEEQPSVRGAEEAGSIGVEGGEEQNAPAAEEARNVRDDAVALAGVLEEIASSDSAPEEVALTGGWGPEHSNAAAFYAKEVALLCGAGAGGEAQVAPGVAGSHLRVRYLDVLSSLVRYNLKLLLNLCVCDMPEAAESVEEEPSPCQEDDDGDAPTHDFETPDSEDGGDSDCGDMFGSSPTLTVVVPGRASLFREEGLPSSPSAAAAAAAASAAAAAAPTAGVVDIAGYGLSVPAQARRGCGCVTVLDGTGALEFNTEDVAALLTLALGRMHPFMPLAARLAAAAAEGDVSGNGDGGSGGCGGGGGDGGDSGGDDEDGDIDGEEVDARVWAAVQQYAMECRAATATAAAEAAAAAAAAAVAAAATAAAAAAGAEASASDASRTDLFSAAAPPAERPGSEAGAETPGSGVARAAQGAADVAAAASTAAAEAALTATAISASVPGECSEESSALTVDEAADLLEYVAAARFVAQLIAEPVVEAGISAGRWAGTESLARQVRKLAEEEAFYSALPLNVQMKVFEPTRQGVRRVVVATTIAETSVTIDGIRYVIDPGFVRLPFYDPAQGFGALLTTLTSKASAKQRAGRAGRVAPGKCLRLMTEEDYHALLPAQTVPEMQRSDLSWVTLLLKALGIDDILHFEFLSPPAAETMIRSLELLYALGALDESCQLTQPLGMTMAEFPVEPCLAKFLVSASDFDCVEDALTVAAMLSVQNPFVHPRGGGRERRERVREAMEEFAVTEGDHITYLNVFNSFEEAGSSSDWCEENCINYRALVRAGEIRSQLSRYCKKFALPGQQFSSCGDDVNALRRCLVAGFFANVAKLSPDGRYRTVRDSTVIAIHPSSVLAHFGSPPEWILFHEISKTSQLFARDVSVVDPRWLIELAPHFYQFRGAPGHAGAAPRLGTKRRLGPERPTSHAHQDSDERAA